MKQAGRGKSRRVGSALAALAVAIGMAISVATPAQASDPVSLGSDHVVDPSGVLGGKTASVEKAIDDLYTKQHIDLYVVYVDTFENPSNAEEWANQTAQQNNLGPTDYLLAVATQDRAYYLSADSAGPISNDQISSIEQNDIEPKLHDDQWAAAAIAAADGLSSAAGGGSGGWGVFLIVIGVIVVAGIVIFLFARSRSRRTVEGQAGAPDPYADLSLKELARQAGSALVQTDDAVKTSADELGFAIAQYGADAAAPFRDALASARQTLTDAFTVQQKLDDEIPDTEEQKRAWYIQILRLCTKANDDLDAQAASFDELRDLAKNAASALAEVQQRHAAAAARVPAAEQELARLRERYSDSAVSTIADNVEQAKARLEFCQTSMADADSRLKAGDSSHAAVAIRAAEGAVDQAALLLDAIDHSKDQLGNAEREAGELIANLGGDIAAAQSLTASGTRDLEAVTVSVQQTVKSAQERLAAPRTDPLGVVQQLQEANTQIDSALQTVRDAQEQARRARAALSQALGSAQAKVQAAEDYITARRGAVGPTARTRLAEAGRLIVQAQQSAATDPATALSQAQRADQLASQAAQLAQQDVGGFGGDDFFGGGRRGGGDMGAVLGGILIGSILGGGGGFGGGGGGGFGGGGFGGGFGGGGFNPGSFGGGGTRSRAGGGRF